MSISTSLVKTLHQQKLTITTAESCTGGLIAAAITDVSGSSAVFHQGVVSYANEAKTRLLGVESGLFETHGAVSEVVAIAMAQGALKAANADIAISVTGIAGPGGGTPEKPVGLVYIGIATQNETSVTHCIFEGDRAAIRAQAVETALQLALAALTSSAFA